MEISNYIIQEKIYESLNSIVLKGLTQDENKPLLLKVLVSENKNPSKFQQLNNEFDILSELSIKGVRKAIGLEKIDSQSVLILEYIEGLPLREYSSVTKITFEKFLKIAISICDVLFEIHRNRIIHKDINPNNILINSDEEIQIIDFGISTKLTIKVTEIYNPEHLEGTLAYISPEQTGRMNRTIDFRSDLYSLGVTFYELITGRVPFQAKDPGELIHSHIAKKELSIFEFFSQRNPITKNKKALEKTSLLISKLLSKKPEDRYQSSRGVKDDLVKIQKLLNHEITDFNIGETDFSEKFVFPEVLFGREKEVNLLKEKLNEIKNEKPFLFLISGYS
ncbi:MAG: serine/threonine protein kinase, partial [Leptospiraceae bacterium]|nr:serine/threonine protein kinase [Leptospiraceae bacterium]